MTWRRFIAVAAGALVLATAAFVGAAVLDAPWMRFVGLLFLAVLGVGYQGWKWRGASREWLAATGAILGVVTVAFVFQKLFG